MKMVGEKGKGKDYLVTLRIYKKLVIKSVGLLGWLLCTPRVKIYLLCCMEDIINELFKGAEFYE